MFKANKMTNITMKREKDYPTVYKYLIYSFLFGQNKHKYRDIIFETT